MVSRQKSLKLRKHFGGIPASIGIAVVNVIGTAARRLSTEMALNIGIDAGRYTELVGRLRNGYAAVAVMLVLVGVPLAKALETLHADRAGFRAAGCWLALHSCPGDYVKDPYSWAHFYAGRVFVEGGVAVPAHVPPVSYVVLERSSNPHPHLPEVQDALNDVRRGRPVQSWPVKRGKERAEVVVYEVAGKLTPYVREGLTSQGAPKR